SPIPQFAVIADFGLGVLGRYPAQRGEPDTFAGAFQIGAGVRIDRIRFSALGQLGYSIDNHEVGVTGNVVSGKDDQSTLGFVLGLRMDYAVLTGRSGELYGCVLGEFSRWRVTDTITDGVGKDITFRNSASEFGVDFGLGIRGPVLRRIELDLN